MFKSNLREVKNTGEAAQRTVAIFSSLLDKKLVLKDAVWPADFSTNGYDLYANGYVSKITRKFGAKELFYRQVEHCLAHIFFGSDAHIKNLFVSTYTKAVEDTLRTERVLDSVKLARLVSSIITIIDDSRALSNWNKIYPGSASDLYRIKKELCSKPASKASGLLSLLIGAIPNTRARYSKYSKTLVDEINTIANETNGGTFTTSLRATKAFIIKAVDTISNYNKCSRGDALAELVNFMEPGSPPAFETYFISLIEGSFGRSTSKITQDNKAVSCAINAATDSYPPSNKEIEETHRQVEMFMSKFGGAGNKHRLCGSTANIPARVIFTDTANEKAYNVALDNTVLSIRAHFMRVLGRKRVILENYGTQPDLTAVIQQRASGRKQPVWLSSARCRGFTALLLIDLSDSIKGCLSEINTATEILQRSMDFDFASVFVWGFKSLADGRVDITRFTKSTIHEKDTGGLTPLNLAIRIATDFLVQQNNAAHLFIATDAAPVFINSRASNCDTESLIANTRSEIQRARRSGVGVSGTILQSGEQVSKESLEYMFGPRKYWTTISGGADRCLVNLVTNSFERYLRTG